MKFSKRQLKKAAMYSLIAALIVPFLSGIAYLVAMSPPPIAFGAILGLISFPFLTYYFR